MCNFMGLPKISENAKFWIFYGFVILWTVWGLVDYFYDYSFQIYLGLLILVLIVWVGSICWNMINVVMPAGNFRFDNSIKIP